ncbi:MAG: SUMF1/EgtB/PvdO family nonheme iron enzyme [Fusobacterium sp.]|nr:SUMF1/EgtB/PvdO family nonheme iron enzyme [Fusobacterium sp.]
MQQELKEKLENLGEKFKNDLDVISLKVLCQVPASEEIEFSIVGILQRLVDKFPDDEEILALLPKKERISLEVLIESLENNYPGNIEVITVKALENLPDGEEKEAAIKECLERLLEENSSDENILDYLEIEESKYKEKNPDMVFVEGGSYIPSFFNEERKVMDLYVSKYQLVQEEWEKYMDKNPSEFKGERRPVDSVSWIEALEFCNKMSVAYGLQPVYKIEEGNLTRIIYKNGEEVYTDLADFTKTEGYRLPTEIEWEYFARGGVAVLKNKTFETKYTENDIGEIAWYDENSGKKTHTVGLKKPNELGLYDCLGNVWEWCYDTASDGFNISEDKPYIYDNDEKYNRIRGCSYADEADEEWDDDDNNYYQFSDRTKFWSTGEDVGFRIVRTA